MVSVRINGSDSPIRGEGLPKMSDLVELIKASIDPDHMITALLLDGKELSDELWFAPTTSLGTAILEVETDTPGRYVTARLADAPDVVQACYLQFRDARKTFQEGKTREGNQKLVKGVHTLRAFFEWYATIYQLIPVERRKPFDMNPLVEEILKVCSNICQQQLYQSWWALGESIKNELEPKLDRLEDFCRKAASQAGAAFA